MLILCLAVFAVLLGVRFMEDDAQQNCLAMVILVSALWATEVCSFLSRHGLGKGKGLSVWVGLHWRWTGVRPYTSPFQKAGCDTRDLRADEPKD